MTGTVVMKCTRLLMSFLFTLMLFGLCDSQQEQYTGPYRIVGHQIDECDETGTHQFYVTGTRINKVSRNKYLYSTNVTSEITVDDDTMGELDIAKFGNGGWRSRFLQLEFPKFCTSMRLMLPTLFTAVLRALDADCPFSPGTRQLKDLGMGNFNIAKSFPMFPYGKYRGDYSLRKNDTLIGCIRYYIEVVPDERAQRHKKKKTNS